MDLGKGNPPDSDQAAAAPHLPFATPSENPAAASATGIEGLDFILHGGLPRSRPTLLRGGPGTGKTVFALTILCHGLINGEPGVLVTFDEAPQALLHHGKVLGLDLSQYTAQGKVRILDMRPIRGDVVTGETFELTAVLARIRHALEQTGAQRLVIDGIDGMEEAFIGTGTGLRNELSRIFDWLRECGRTTLITAGERTDFSRQYGVEDYVADCVIELKQELNNRSMSRLLRVIKKRGGGHESNEFPFLVDHEGIFVLPVTGTKLRSCAATQRISTGISGLDRMLGGQGPYLGGTLMYSGQSGTGKTTFAAHFAHAAFLRGENVLYVSFEEGAAELVRNQSSIGLDLNGRPNPGGIHPGKLLLKPILAAELGGEEHLLRVMRLVQRHQPSVVILDPVSALGNKLKEMNSKALMLRLLHMLKNQGVTTVITELLGDGSNEVSSLDISSMIDVWVKLIRREREGRLHRLLSVVKARGMATADYVSEFTLSGNGVTIQGGR
ncbi:MAG: circadian clock protein KaiC [Deltaproteobacteria bacterium]|nr:circadian clock protein KaiC [Deltaproteobacteria bacterium]